jgi:hypothetical protein
MAEQTRRIKLGEKRKKMKASGKSAQSSNLLMASE